MRRLEGPEFKATFGGAMVRRGPEEEPPFDFWPYFDRLPEEEFLGFDFSAGQVSQAYVDSAGRYEHVLLRCEDENVFLVLVLNLGTQQVHGHRVLNLNEEYGFPA